MRATLALNGLMRSRFRMFLLTWMQVKTMSNKFYVKSFGDSAQTVILKDSMMIGRKMFLNTSTGN